jgi:hypothetical protein
MGEWLITLGHRPDRRYVAGAADGRSVTTGPNQQRARDNFCDSQVKWAGIWKE